MGDDDDRCEGKPWGFLATLVSDAGACIADCRQQFLTALSPKDETIERVCELFSNKDGEAGQLLHRLYCCDAQICGVDNLEMSGEDRTVFPWALRVGAELTQGQPTSIGSSILVPGRSSLIALNIRNLHRT
jgi:hypothetical protein